MSLLSTLLSEAKKIWGRNVIIYDEDKMDATNKCSFMLLINNCQYRNSEKGWVGNGTIMASFGKGCGKDNIGELTRLYALAQSTEYIQGVSSESIDYKNQMVSLDFDFNIKCSAELDKNYGKIEKGEFYYDNTI